MPADTVKILLLAAVLPGLFLAWRIYRLDRIEKEPFGLLAKLFFLGALSIIPAMILEWVGINVLTMLVGNNSVLFVFLETFLVVACAEEWGKYHMLKKYTWYKEDFNYRFDGIVYAVSVSLGFAVFENIEYVFSYGMAAAVIRAITAVPAHTIFGIFMGHYYGEAKCYDAAGFHTTAARYRKYAYIVPVLLHGFYDFTASLGSGIMTIIFWVFVIILDILSIRQLHKDSREDIPI